MPYVILINNLKYFQKTLDNTCNTPIKKASDLNDIPCGKGVSTTYVCCDLEVKSIKPIKKTLTIPEWVNKIGVEHNINFSQTLTDAILRQYTYE